MMAQFESLEGSTHLGRSGHPSCLSHPGHSARPVRGRPNCSVVAELRTAVPKWASKRLYGRRPFYNFSSSSFYSNTAGKPSHQHQNSWLQQKIVRRSLVSSGKPFFSKLTPTIFRRKTTRHPYTHEITVPREKNAKTLPLANFASSKFKLKFGPCSVSFLITTLNRFTYLALSLHLLNQCWLMLLGNCSTASGRRTRANL